MASKRSGHGRCPKELCELHVGQGDEMLMVQVLAIHVNDYGKLGKLDN